ncbi:MAG: DUF4126 domain-containing protein [Myxococcota bacterium]
MGLSLTIVAACLGLAFASGLNCYAVVMLLALSGRLGDGVPLPGQLEWASHSLAFWLAAALYVVEFFVDQRRRLGTVWDAMHAFVRPVVGAGLAFLALAPAPLTLRVAGAVVGGGLAFAAHGTKASIRLAARARRQARVTVLLSLTEDVAAAVLTYLALRHPAPALAMVAAGGVTTAVILPRVLFAFARATNRTLDSLISRAKAPE